MAWEWLRAEDDRPSPQAAASRSTAPGGARRTRELGPRVPELPEVEVIRRHLVAAMPAAGSRRWWSPDRRSVRRQDPDRFVSRLTRGAPGCGRPGRQVPSSCPLDDGDDVLVVHLRMSGPAAPVRPRRNPRPAPHPRGHSWSRDGRAAPLRRPPDLRRAVLRPPAGESGGTTARCSPISGPTPSDRAWSPDDLAQMADRPAPARQEPPHRPAPGWPGWEHLLRRGALWAQVSATTGRPAS